MAEKGRILIPGLYDSSDESENGGGVDQSFADDVAIDSTTPEPNGEEVVVEHEEEYVLESESNKLEQEQKDEDDGDEEYDPTDAPFLIRKPLRTGVHSDEELASQSADEVLQIASNDHTQEEEEDASVSNYYVVVDVISRSVKVIAGGFNEKMFTTLEQISADTFATLNERVYPNPEDDDHFYCEQCVMSFRVCCIKHPLYRILDRPVLNPIEDRAKKTLPAFIKIKTSAIPNAGLGAFTMVELPVGVVFGPYQGILSKDSDNLGYSWEIRNVDGPSMFLDGSDPKYSNWMRYINSPRHDREQNLVAFQYNGSVYYRVFKPIDVEQELLVWYGAKYGESLGVFSTKRSATKTRSVTLADAKNPFIM